MGELHEKITFCVSGGFCVLFCFLQNFIQTSIVNKMKHIISVNGPEVECSPQNKTRLHPTPIFRCLGASNTPRVPL